MKHWIYMAATLLVMVGCNNKDEVQQPQQTGEGAFKQGDHVTITVGDDVKAPVRKLGGQIGSTGIEFTWEEGDELTITVGSASAQFTLTSGEGTANGVFEGEMPAGGDSFTAEYKGANYQTFFPQTYTAGGIDKTRIYAKAENCTIKDGTWSEIALAVTDRFVLCFNLQGPDQVEGIYFSKDNSILASKTQWLSCSPAVQLSTSAPTSFAIVVPMTYADYKMQWYDFTSSIIVYTNNGQYHSPEFKITANAGDYLPYATQKKINFSIYGTCYYGTNYCATGEKACFFFTFNESNKNRSYSLEYEEGGVTKTISSQSLENLAQAINGSVVNNSGTFTDANDGNKEYEYSVVRYYNNEPVPHPFYTNGDNRVYIYFRVDANTYNKSFKFRLL